MEMERPCMGTWRGVPGKSNPSVKSYNAQLLQAAAGGGGRLCSHQNTFPAHARAQVGF